MNENLDIKWRDINSLAEYCTTPVIRDISLKDYTIVAYDSNGILVRLTDEGMDKYNPDGHCNVLIGFATKTTQGKLIFYPFPDGIAEIDISYLAGWVPLPNEYTVHKRTCPRCGKTHYYSYPEPGAKVTYCCPSCKMKI